MAVELTVRLRNIDAWVLDQIRDNVDTKRHMGFSVSLDFEVGRVLKLGLMGGTSETICKRVERLHVRQVGEDVEHAMRVLADVPRADLNRVISALEDGPKAEAAIGAAIDTLLDAVPED